MTRFEPNDSYMDLARAKVQELDSPVGIVGYGVATLYAVDGSIKQAETFANKISDAGDQYYATRAAAAVAPTGIGDATKVTGMKLGTSSATAPGKATGNLLGTYQTLSNKIFTSTALAAVGSSGGYNLTYTTNWVGADVWTALVEAVIVNDAGTNATTTAANTIARVTFSAVNKGATDTFAIAWIHTFLGG